MDFSSIVTALFKLFFLLVLGYVLNKKKILDSHTNSGMSALLVNATNPALILSSLSATEAATKGEVSRLLLFGVGWYIFLPIMAFVMVRLLRIQPAKRGTAQLLLIFSNTGFMAIPVLQTLYGDIAVFYSNILNLPFNFLLYSYGVFLLTRDKGRSSGDSISWRQFLNPGIVASAIALIIYFCGLRLPVMLNEAFSFLGGVTPPLSMVILGSVLAEYPLSSMFKDLRINLMLLLKQLLLPMLAMLLGGLVFTNSVITGIITLTFAMPCASMAVILSKEYQGDTMTASVSVVFTTAISLITIPVIFLLFVM